VFKKYFWAIKLAGIALLALVSAGVVNDVIASKLFVLPPVRASGSTDGVDPMTPIDTELGRVATSVNAARELAARRVFKLEPPVVVVEEPPAEEPPPEPVKTSDELEASQLPINLIGTFVSTSPEYSYANLQIEGEHKIASQGSEYLDGKARVIKIASGHIVLKEDNRFTYVSMWEQGKAAAAAPRPGMPPSMPGRPSPMAPSIPSVPTPVSGAGDRDDVASGVTKTGAYDYSIERKMLDRQLQDLPKLQSEARVVPHYKDNQYQGFKLVGVRPGSLYRAIGIRSGDVITAVNGNKIDSPNKALELFEQLKSSSNINVEIERRGQPKTLGYTIQ
jgi:general secretion pathway protein C